MKIAIYGDSYADNHRDLHDSSNHDKQESKMFKKAFNKLGYTDLNTFLSNLTLKYKCWVDLLSETYNVTNYARGGTDCYFSYRSFLETHEQYDKIIFLKTFPGRLSLYNKHWHHYYNVSSIIADDKMSSVVRDYFIYVQPEDNFRTELFDNLMIEDVLRRRPDTINIDIAFTSKTNSIPLYDIYKTESKFWNIDYEEINYLDARQCHMSYKNNVMIYKKMCNSIENSTPFLLSHTDILTPGNKEDYIFNSINDFINFVMK
jgi:hypothetical protein